ncbi:hypothetical protein SAMN05216382_0745 [Sphingomonas palmae]|uniref:Uncharacterized protein n=1 Tax=Sphingomonas palmae TaxID=1855283 RepID=A0A1H7IE06_9SPHN|nr:hypothetical protein [Sphingomonas palmae]SEK60688.1 hypothetical protein SAMN05216382_0745 [Sphingomonas palmae]
MDEDRITQTPHTTVIERRGSSSGLIIGIIALVVICVGAYFLFVGSNSEVAKNNAITSAAKSVGSTADKAGAAIDKNS